MRLTSIILKPVLTEKSTALNSANKYMFEVSAEANAGSIKQELKKLYGVDVVSVWASILPGKKRRKGKTAQFKKTAQRKRLIVKLKSGQKIDALLAEKVK